MILRSRALRYVVAGICALLAIGTLPSVYFLSMGLATGLLSEGERGWLIAKLLAYIAEIAVLSYAAWWLLKSPRKTTA